MDTIRFRIASSMLIAFFATSGIYFWNVEVQKQKRLDEALMIARQIYYQTESLARLAEKTNERDALVWASDIMSRGVEPRLVKVVPAKVPFEKGSEEIYDHDLLRNELDYARVYSPQDGRGFRISVKTQFAGFLGAPTRFFADLYAAIVFALTFSFSFLSQRIFSHRLKSRKRNRQFQKWGGDLAIFLAKVEKRDEQIRDQMSSVGQRSDHLQSEMERIQERIAERAIAADKFIKISGGFFSALEMLSNKSEDLDKTTILRLLNKLKDLAERDQAEIEKFVSGWADVVSGIDSLDSTGEIQDKDIHEAGEAIRAGIQDFQREIDALGASMDEDVA